MHVLPESKVTKGGSKYHTFFQRIQQIFFLAYRQQVYSRKATAKPDIDFKALLGRKGIY
jgi:hypothetical protein